MRDERYAPLLLLWAAVIGLMVIGKESVDSYPILTTLSILFTGLVFRKMPPEYLRGYENIKDNPKALRASMKGMSIVANLFVVVGLLLSLLMMISWASRL